MVTIRPNTRPLWSRPHTRGCISRPALRRLKCSSQLFLRGEPGSRCETHLCGRAGGCAAGRAAAGPICSTERGSHGAPRRSSPVGASWVRAWLCIKRRGPAPGLLRLRPARPRRYAEPIGLVVPGRRASAGILLVRSSTPSGPLALVGHVLHLVGAPLVGHAAPTQLHFAMGGPSGGLHEGCPTLAADLAHGRARSRCSPAWPYRLVRTCAHNRPSCATGCCTWRPTHRVAVCSAGHPWPRDRAAKLVCKARRSVGARGGLWCVAFHVRGHVAHKQGQPQGRERLQFQLDVAHGRVVLGQFTPIHPRVARWPGWRGAPRGQHLPITRSMSVPWVWSARRSTCAYRPGVGACAVWSTGTHHPSGCKQRWSRCTHHPGGKWYGQQARFMAGWNR